MASLTPEAFDLLIKHFDPDPSRSGEIYIDLHLKLTKYFSWGYCPASHAESLADEVLNRYALKLSQGLEIENRNAYAHRIAFNVKREKCKNVPDPLDDRKDLSVPPEIEEDPELRLVCLRICLIDVIPEKTDRTLILEYYDIDTFGKIKEKRKSLADSLGMTMTNLKVKAHRLRERLENCISECVRKRQPPVTN